MGSHQSLFKYETIDSVNCIILLQTIIIGYYVYIEWIKKRF